MEISWFKWLQKLKITWKQQTVLIINGDVLILLVTLKITKDYWKFDFRSNQDSYHLIQGIWAIYGSLWMILKKIQHRNLFRVEEITENPLTRVRRLNRHFQLHIQILVNTMEWKVFNLSSIEQQTLFNSPMAPFKLLRTQTAPYSHKNGAKLSIYCLVYMLLCCGNKLSNA